MDIQPWERRLWAFAKAARDAEADTPPDYTFSFARQRPTEIKGLVSKDMGIVRAPVRAPETHPHAYGRKRLDDPAYDTLEPDDALDGTGGRFGFLNSDPDEAAIYPDDVVEDDPAFALRDQVHHDVTDHGIAAFYTQEESDGVERVRIARERRLAIANSEHDCYVTHMRVENQRITNGK